MADKVYHWRRHNEAAVSGARDVCASACGRLVSVYETTRTAENTDCEACILVRDLLADWQARTAAAIVVDAFADTAKSP